MSNALLDAVVAADALANAQLNALVAALELVLVFAHWNARGSVQVCAHLIASDDSELVFELHCWWPWSF